MGFFSWKTQDTARSIPNRWSTRKPFTVVMLDDKGNKWFEQDYDGYGRFGGKDYYELLAEMNGAYVDKDFRDTMTDEQYTDMMRMEGINMAFKNNPSGEGTDGVKFPNLVEMAEGWQYDPIGPESCDYQGFFYDDTETDEVDEWDSTLMDGLEDEENDFNN
jgi:hypothetical protein